MPGMSPLVSISRLGTCHLKRLGEGFRVPFCDPSEGVLEFLFGDVFCMRGDPLKKKTYQDNEIKERSAARFSVSFSLGKDGKSPDLFSLYKRHPLPREVTVGLDTVARAGGE